MLNVIDEGMREYLEIEIDTLLTAAPVVRLLEEIIVWHGFPKRL